MKISFVYVYIYYRNIIHFLNINISILSKLNNGINIYYWKYILYYKNQN